MNKADKKKAKKAYKVAHPRPEDLFLAEAQKQAEGCVKAFELLGQAFPGLFPDVPGAIAIGKKQAASIKKQKRGIK